MINLSMAVVIRHGKVLIQKRYRNSVGMVFEFPGGSVDSGESGEQAAVRELWEETGLKNLNVLGNHKSQNNYGGEISYIILSASDGVEPVALDPERQQTFYWFDRSSIPLSDFYSSDIEFIENHLETYT